VLMCGLGPSFYRVKAYRISTVNVRLGSFLLSC